MDLLAVGKGREEHKVKEQITQGVQGRGMVWVNIALSTVLVTVTCTVVQKGLRRTSLLYILFLAFWQKVKIGRDTKTRQKPS